MGYAAGGVATARHGDGAVRRLEGGDVVHAVAHHGHAVAVLSQRLDQTLLVLGGYAAEDGVMPGQRGIILLAFDSGKIHRAVCAGHTGGGRGMGDGQRTVARNHLERDALLAKVAYGFLHVGTQRIAQA